MTIKAYLSHIQKEGQVCVYVCMYVFPLSHTLLSRALSNSFLGTVPCIYKPLYFLIKRK